MNCIPSFRVGALSVTALLLAACGTQVADPDAPADPLRYRVEYVVEPNPTEGSVAVSMRVAQSRSLLRQLTMRIDGRVSGLDADGDLVLLAGGLGARVALLPGEREEAFGLGGDGGAARGGDVRHERRRETGGLDGEPHARAEDGGRVPGQGHRRRSEG